MNLPAPTFIGFCPKATVARPDWLMADSVKEIGSVSGCFSKLPENWMTHWKHNSFGFFDSEEIALSILAGDPEPYELYAYEMYPFNAFDRRLDEMEVDVQIGSVPPSFEFLGYDIVTKSSSDFFECSPLSCNNAATHFPTNANCLMDDETAAYQAMLDMSVPGSLAEPGPCYLFKVYRKRRP